MLLLLFFLICVTIFTDLWCYSQILTTDYLVPELPNACISIEPNKPAIRSKDVVQTQIVPRMRLPLRRVVMEDKGSVSD